MKKRQFAAMTAIVPAIEIPALEGAPVDETCQTQAIGRVGFKSLITLIRTKTPETQDRTKLTSMKN
jgi:hypothetical protein